MTLGLDMFQFSVEQNFDVLLGLRYQIIYVTVGTMCLE